MPIIFIELQVYETAKRPKFDGCNNFVSDTEGSERWQIGTTRRARRIFFMVGSREKLERLRRSKNSSVSRNSADWKVMIYSWEAWYAEFFYFTIPRYTDSIKIDLQISVGRIYCNGNRSGIILTIATTRVEYDCFAQTKWKKKWASVVAQVEEREK